MKLRDVSLRTAVILPTVIIMLAILALFVVLNTRDYEFLAEEQGSRILDALYRNTEQRLSALLVEPMRANAFYKDYITREILYDYQDLEEVEKYTLDFMTQLRETLPQVSVISYGDELGNYLGYRLNEDDMYGLMLKDARTNFDLNIYAGQTIDTELLAGFKDYDPRTRPWYLPAKLDPTDRWSDVYVNYDEKMELAITTFVSFYNDKEAFTGVVGIDVKLNMINDFLIAEDMKGNGVIYIVDEDWNILSHSLNTDFVKVIEGDPPSAVMLSALEAENPLIRQSAEFIRDQETKSGEVQQIYVDGQRYFTMVSPLKDPEGLDWNIVVTIPEKDILGAVKERQNTTLRVISLFLVVAMVGAMYLLSKITKPILQSSEAALQLSEGDFETKLDIDGLQLYETKELVIAFNNMSDKLKNYFSRIKKSETKYRSLIENVDDMIYSISKDGIFLSMNNSFEEALDIKADSLIGKPFTEIFTSYDAMNYWLKMYHEVLQSKETISFPFEYFDEDNQRKILNVNLIPQMNTKGEIETILGTNTDITELVVAQDEIERLLKAEKEELESLVMQRTAELETTMQELRERERLASLGSLVAGIAHEINTPLGVAVTASSYMEKINSGIFQSLKEGSLSKQSLIEYIKTMDESTEIINANLYRASELIRSFKEISVQQSVEKLQVFAVEDYIQDVLLALKHEYKNTEHTFEVDCDSDLEIKSYPGAFSQILTNLIINSLTHGFEGVEKGLMKIKAYMDEEDFIFEYEDNGVGISKEHLAHIFDPFFTTNRKKGGSGLGLNIVYNIVTGKLNGKIQCDSDVGQGAKFVIRVPIDKHIA